MFPVFQKAVEQIYDDCEEVAAKLFSVFDLTEDEISAILIILGDAHHRKAEKYYSFEFKSEGEKMDEEENDK